MPDKNCFTFSVELVIVHQKVWTVVVKLEKLSVNIGRCSSQVYITPIHLFNQFSFVHSKQMSKRKYSTQLQADTTNIPAICHNRLGLLVNNVWRRVQYRWTTFVILKCESTVALYFEYKFTWRLKTLRNVLTRTRNLTS